MNTEKRGYTIERNAIIINRKLNSLDFFLKDFISVLERHSNYLVVSGYVSISSGRSRGTEDIDIIMPSMPRDKFNNLFADLIMAGFWCYQGDKKDEAYSYIANLTCVRFARTGEIFPNIELIPFNKNDKLKTIEFNSPQKMRVENFEFKIPPIEFEIAYKEVMLGSDKDIADANHLKTFFSDIINPERYNHYKKIIKNEKTN